MDGRVSQVVAAVCVYIAVPARRCRAPTKVRSSEQEVCATHHAHHANTGPAAPTAVCVRGEKSLWWCGGCGDAVARAACWVSRNGRGAHNFYIQGLPAWGDTRPHSHACTHATHCPPSAVVLRRCATCAALVAPFVQVKATRGVSRFFPTAAMFACLGAGGRVRGGPRRPANSNVQDIQVPIGMRCAVVGGSTTPHSARGRRGLRKVPGGPFERALPGSMRGASCPRGQAGAAAGRVKRVRVCAQASADHFRVRVVAACLLTHPARR